MNAKRDGDEKRWRFNEKPRERKLNAFAILSLWQWFECDSAGCCCRCQWRMDIELKKERKNVSDVMTTLAYSSSMCVKHGMNAKLLFARVVGFNAVADVHHPSSTGTIFFSCCVFVSRLFLYNFSFSVSLCENVHSIPKWSGQSIWYAISVTLGL